MNLGEGRRGRSASSEAERPRRRQCRSLLNRDAGDSLLSCVASLRAAGVGEIIVVDNSTSSDGSLAQLSEAHDLRSRCSCRLGCRPRLRPRASMYRGQPRATGGILLAC